MFGRRKLQAARRDSPDAAHFADDRRERTEPQGIFHRG